jgi:hypothetical protein
MLATWRTNWAREAWERATVARRAQLASERTGDQRLTQSASRLDRSHERLDGSERRLTRGRQRQL